MRVFPILSLSIAILMLFQNCGDPCTEDLRDGYYFSYPLFENTYLRNIVTIQPAEPQAA